MAVLGVGVERKQCRPGKASNGWLEVGWRVNKVDLVNGAHNWIVAFMYSAKTAQVWGARKTKALL